MGDSNHVCAKCGKPLNPMNWWTAGVTDRFGGQTFKLCEPCAMSVSFAVQSVIAMDGEVGGVVMKGERYV